MKRTLLVPAVIVLASVFNLPEGVFWPIFSIACFLAGFGFGKFIASNKKQAAIMTQTVNALAENG